jgi:hypothetical protein
MSAVSLLPFPLRVASLHAEQSCIVSHMQLCALVYVAEVSKLPKLLDVFRRAVQHSNKYIEHDKTLPPNVQLSPHNIRRLNKGQPVCKLRHVMILEILLVDSFTGLIYT